GSGQAQAGLVERDGTDVVEARVCEQRGDVIGPEPHGLANLRRLLADPLLGLVLVVLAAFDVRVIEDEAARGLAARGNALQRGSNGRLGQVVDDPFPNQQRSLAGIEPGPSETVHEVLLLEVARDIGACIYWVITESLE